MASKTKKRVTATTTPTEEAPHSTDPWRPQVESEPEFNPFSSTGVGGDARTQIGESGQETAPIRDASEDTAPLQGTRDFSDSDQLRDVVASNAEAPQRGRSGRPRAAATLRSARTRGATARRATKAKRRPARKASPKKAKRSGATTKAKGRARRATSGRRSARARRGAKRR